MDFNTTKSIKKQSSLKKIKERSSSKAGHKLSEKISLEKVLGLTVKCNSHLVVHEPSHQCAYLAGSVVVILNSKTNEQKHIINSCRKTLSSVDFSHDGVYIATGETGHQPAVRVWNIDEAIIQENGGCGVQVVELHGHSFGIPIVAFAPHGSLLVSVGNQHDQEVNVWNWRSGLKVASNKVSIGMQTIAFSEDGKWFVTCGHRHIRFWYIEKTSKNLNVEPLKGKAALLGEKKSMLFCDIATGKGLKSTSCFAVSKEGILCEFNAKRHLTKWVDLRTAAAYCLAVGKRNIYCGCANGGIRVFEVLSLDYLSTFPKPHFLGTQVAACTDSCHLSQHPEDVKYPDCVAVQLDEVNQKLYACYNDHSLYIWDVFNLNRIGKYSSFLFHSGAVRDVKVYPELEVPGPLPAGSFLTCSNDNTLRIWNLFPQTALSATAYEPNVYSNELVDIVYIDSDHLVDQENSKQSQQSAASTAFALGSVHGGSYAVLPSDNVGQDDYKAGLRCLALTDNGTHIAAGDRMGNVRIYDAAMLHKGELLTLEAHDSEVLALEYSPSAVDVAPLLATASRDRLLHVLSVNNNYDLVITSADHSSSITGVKFNQLANGVLQLVSCAADKSLVFRNAPEFNREHNVAEKTTFYDLTLDTELNQFAAACQDRNIRFYDCETSKLVRTIKGSEAEDGNVNRLCFDPTQTYIATCCSDKTICLLDKQSGEIVATVSGHSESITGLAFTNDSKRLISTCADSCVFVWKLSRQLTYALSSNNNSSSTTASRSASLSRRTVSSNAVHQNQQQDKSMNSQIRGRILSESWKPEISRAILLDDDDTELPSWLKKSSGGQSSLSTSLGGLNAGGAGGGDESMLCMPSGRWADRANEQMSLATSVNVASDGDELTLCDPHQFFTGNLAVKRYNSGSESNASVASSTNLAEDNRVCNFNATSDFTSPSSPVHQFEIEDIEVSSAEDEEADEPNLPSTARPEGDSRRPTDLPLGSRPRASDLPTPVLGSKPKPIYLHSGDKKGADKGRGSVSSDKSESGAASGSGFKVNMSNDEQLSPDSVDKENESSEEQDYISDSESGPGDEGKFPRKSKLKNASRRSPRAVAAAEEEEEDEGDDEREDEFPKGRDEGGQSFNDATGEPREEDFFSEDRGADPDDMINRSSTMEQPRSRGRRDSLSSRHLKEMNTQQLLTNKKTVDEIRRDSCPREELNEQINSSEGASTNPRLHQPNVSSVASGDRAPKKFQRTHLTPGNQKLTAGSTGLQRSGTFNLNMDNAESHRIRTSSSMREPAASRTTSTRLGTRKNAGSNAVDANSNPVTRDRSAESSTMAHRQQPPSVQLTRRGALTGRLGSTSSGQGQPADKTGGDTKAAVGTQDKPQNLKRYKSDNALARRHTVTQNAASGATASSTALSATQSRTNFQQPLTTSSEGQTLPQNAPATEKASSCSKPGYAKATCSSHLKTTSMSSNNSMSGSNTTLHKATLSGSQTNVAELSEDSLDERSSNSAVSGKPKKSSKAPIQKYASNRVSDKKKLKTWKSADSLCGKKGTLVAKSEDFSVETKARAQTMNDAEDVALASPTGSKHTASFLTPTNPVDLNNVEEAVRSSQTSRKSSSNAATAAPCFFCIRKETGMDDDEGFVSNGYRHDRCACMPEQLLRLRAPKNTDPGLSDSDLEDSDNRSGSDYFVSQQDLNLAGCQRAVNRLNHSFKVVSGYHQQAEFCDEKDEIIQLLTDTCTQIQHSMVSRGMVCLNNPNYQLDPEDLQQLRMKVQFPPSQSASRSARTGSSEGGDNSATLHLLQHYSDLLVNLVQQQLSHKDQLHYQLSSSESASNVGVNYSDQANEDDNSVGGTEEEQTETDDQPSTSSAVMQMSHAPSNETLEDI